jgi:hypothetical protein
MGARGLSALIIAILMIHPAQATAPVDTALVIAVDVSLSVDDARYTLQKDGTAAAFETESVREAVAAGPNGAIEVTVMEFSDPDRQIVVVPWTRIGSADDAHRFAEKLRGVHRSSHGLTDLAEALVAADALLHTVPAPSTRKIVDMSSDGMSNIGTDITEARDLLKQDGITINGLPILSEEPWLGTYYTEYVIGGPDAFMEVAEDPSSFAAAMQRKLARELLLSGEMRGRGKRG